MELHRDPGSTGSGPEPFSLRTAFPRRLFTDEDMEKPLQELGQLWGGPEGVWGAQGGFRRSLRGLKGSPKGFEGP